MEAFERISHIFSVLALFPWFSDIISTSSLYLAATCSCALRQSTEASGRISYVFHVKVDSEFPAQFAPANPGFFSSSSFWQSPRASVR